MIVSCRKLSLFISILLFLFLFPVLSLYAQTSVLNRSITITAINQPVYEVLGRIGRQSGIKFSYNPDDISARRIITIRADKEPLNKVLQQIIDNPALAFREMGNQVIIYKPSSVSATQAELQPNAGSKSDAPKPVTSQVVKPSKPDTTRQVSKQHHDTVFLAKTDTVIKLDTLILHDTIHRFDTVFIEKQVPVKKELNGKTKSRERSPYSIELSYTQYFGKAALAAVNGQDELLNMAKISESASLQNLTTGILLNYDLKNTGFSSGLLYSRFGEFFDHEYLQQIGGYYRHDTVETYYTVSGPDTSWYYITDSTWLNLDYKKYTYLNTNTLRYFEIPFSVKYFPVRNNKWSWYVRGGIVAGVCLGSKTMVIDPETSQAVWVDNDIIRPLVFSWTTGTGVVIKIDQNLEFTAEATYRWQLTQLYSGYPIEKKYKLPGIKAGLCIRL